MITLLLLSSFVDARHRKPKQQTQGFLARMNEKRHAAAAKMKAEAAELNAKRHAAADKMRAMAAEANKRRHAMASAMRGE
jgi:hypothetical protein